MALRRLYIWLSALSLFAACNDGNMRHITATITSWKGGTYEGELDSLGRPSGLGLYCDSVGNIYYGEWKDGVLNGSVVRTDTLGNRHSEFWKSGIFESAVSVAYVNGDRYVGSTDSLGRHVGNGMLQTANGEIFSGSWVDGQIDGFCIGVTAKGDAKIGYWLQGKFKGERMVLSADRVYGIDISRYQHKGNAAIDWRRLLITSFGKRSSLLMTNSVISYPVSFVYIKATEGVTFKSRYYRSDAIAANRHRIPFGAYHFFSTTSPVLQADNFLKTIAGIKTKLPPMLDVELSEDQIFEMGGANVLFSRIKTWMDIVESKTGRKPVLYCGQTFVNSYLAEAPAYILRYPLWVARYSEYKPYSHISLWQLAEDATVRGIKGGVDVNVFNGSKEQFAEFVGK